MQKDAIKIQLQLAKALDLITTITLQRVCTERKLIVKD